MGAGDQLLHGTLGLRARMVGEVLIGLGDLRLERGQFRVPGVSHFLGTHGIALNMQRTPSSASTSANSCSKSSI